MLDTGIDVPDVVNLVFFKVARTKIRSLARLVDKVARERVYSDFEDVMGEAAEVEILQTELSFDKERFTAKARHFFNGVKGSYRRQ